MEYELSKIEELRNYMIKNGKTIAIAESVTSGHLQAAFSSATNASLFYQGGITTYNLGQKCKHLKIDPILAAPCDCISLEIAEKMALSVAELFVCNYGIGITGYAAPGPEKNIQNIFAFYALAYDGRILKSGRITSDKDNSQDVQIDYANQVITALLKVCNLKSPAKSSAGSSL